MFQTYNRSQLDLERDDVAGTHLHPAHPHSERPRSRRIALLPLTPFLQRRRVKAVLPSAHLEIQHTGVFQSPRQIFHEDEQLLPGDILGRALRYRR